MGKRCAAAILYSCFVGSLVWMLLAAVAFEACTRSFDFVRLTPHFAQDDKVVVGTARRE